MTGLAYQCTPLHPSLPPLSPQCLSPLPSFHITDPPPPPLSLFPGVFCFSELSFIIEPSDITVISKDPVVLDCVAHGQPPIVIGWLRNGVGLAESERLRFLSNGSLYILEARRDGEGSDGGFYQCLSQNKYGAILSQRSRLTIANISPFVVQPVPLEVTEGSVARFTCQVTSNPPATITWELDQSTLPLETDRITVLPNGALQIQNVQLEDAGKYRCVATNIGNRVKSRKATLSVINQGVCVCFQLRLWVDLFKSNQIKCIYIALRS
ncbi:unnamed protein product [Oncorhynchus mykiss]|uniref:Ig-like domain-containing protein n=1 Tax=Oncorhynchus mykiss TaxID=8022 RepID=A0A060YHA7_ONCMY|nr:unnamed protein product [Oncorhynchus mykiss]